jgi:2-amino-4-hydroxy-6-hydroxymethyldihydropteridine diphosphokinase
MPRVYVSIGSNVDRAANFRSAYAAMARHFSNLRPSPVYESAPVGFEGDNFLNAVIACDTELPLPETLAVLAGIERDLGRVRGGDRFGPRTIDLDLLTYGDAVVECGTAVVPRAEITEYAFVLRPLAELAPDVTHPRLPRTFKQIWESFESTGQALWVVEFDWKTQ